MILSIYIYIYINPSLSILSLVDRDKMKQVNRDKAILTSTIKILITRSHQQIPFDDHRVAINNDVKNNERN